jgi:hypothetical protein
MKGLTENTALQSDPMMLGSGPVNWGQLQNWKKFKFVNEGTQGAVRWFAPPPIAGEVLPVLDYLRQIRSERVGVDAASQGLQPDQLSGIAAVAIAGAQAASARVVRYAVRTLAETGLRRVFQKLLRLMVGMPPEHVIGQNGAYTFVDPRQFDPAWKVRARVGLGAMALQDRKQAYQQLLGFTQTLISGLGMKNPFTTPQKVAALIQAAAGEFKELGAQRFLILQMRLMHSCSKRRRNSPRLTRSFLRFKRTQRLNNVRYSKTDKLSGAELQVEAAAREMDINSRAAAAHERNQMTHAERMLEMAIQVPLEREAIRARTQAGQGNIPRRINGNG